MNRPFAIYGRAPYYDEGGWSLIKRYATPESTEQAYAEIIREPLNMKYIIMPYSGKYLMVNEKYREDLLKASKP